MQINEDCGRISCVFVTNGVSWEEMLEAVVLFRDKLTVEIAEKRKCPMSPDRFIAIETDERVADHTTRLAEIAQIIESTEPTVYISPDQRARIYQLAKGN